MAVEMKVDDVPGGSAMAMPCAHQGVLTVL